MPSSGGIATLYNTGDLNEGTGIFTAPLSGVYIVACNVRIDGISWTVSDEIQVRIALDGKNDTNNGLAATFGSPAPNQTFSVIVNGAVHLKKGQTLQVALHSQTNTTFVVKHESGFSARYLAALPTVLGVFWKLSATSAAQKIGWYELNGYRTLFNQQVGTGMYPQDGRYTAPCNGVYYVAANIRIDGAGGQYFRTLIAINQRLDVSNGLHTINSNLKSTSFTMSVSGTVYLDKGANISVFIYSHQDTSWQVSNHSSLSIAYLSPQAASIPGVHADLLADTLANSTRTWVTIKYWRVTGAPGLYQSGSEFNPTTGVFTTSTSGFYHISAQICLEGAGSGSFRLGISVNGSISVDNGLHAIRGSPPGNYYTLCVAGVVPLNAGTRIAIVIYSDFDLSGRIRHESGLSVHLMERISPGFHAYVLAATHLSYAGWLQVPHWKTIPGTSDGLFQTGSNFVPRTGIYTVLSPGIYYVATNVGLDRITSGTANLVVSVNNELSHNNGLRATETFLPQSSQSLSLHTSGFVRLDAGDKVAIHVQSTSDSTWILNSESGFSLAYIGAPLSIPAFMATPIQSIQYARTGWFELTGPWRTSGVNSLFNSGGRAFNPQTGRFTAPIFATYWVCANVWFSGLSDTGSSLLLAIGVNGQYSLSNSFSAKRSAPASTGAFTLSVSGALQLQTGDYVSVWVGSDKDTSWTVLGQSSFSVAQVGSELLPGFSSIGPKMTSSSTGYLRQASWNNPALSGFFNTFGSTPSNGLFRAPQSGWYIVAANVQMSATGTGHSRASVAIDDNNSVNNGLHANQGDQPAQASMSVAGVVRLRAQQSLSVSAYRNTAFQFSTQGFSAVAVGSPAPMPSFHAHRWGNNLNTNGVHHIQSYNNAYYQWKYDMNTNTFNQTSGKFTAKVTGVYWVSATVELRNATGNYFQLIASVNGQFNHDGGLVSSTGVPSSSFYTMTVSGTVWLNAQDTVTLGVNSNSDVSYRIDRVDFSVHFLQYGAASTGFNSDLVSSVLKNIGWFPLENWQTVPSVANGLYQKDASFVNGTFTVSQGGVYLVSAQIRLDAADQGYFWASLSINGSNSQATSLGAVKTGATHKDYFTLSLAGALYLPAGSTLQPKVYASADKNWWAFTESGFSAAYLAPLNQVSKNSSVYSFSSSCPKTVSRTREVFPTGSTTLLRLQLSRTRDCAHRSRHVGLFLFFFLLERKVPAQSKLKE